MEKRSRQVVLILSQRKKFPEETVTFLGKHQFESILCRCFKEVTEIMKDRSPVAIVFDATDKRGASLDMASLLRRSADACRASLIIVIPPSVRLAKQTSLCVYADDFLIGEPTGVELFIRIARHLERSGTPPAGFAKNKIAGEKLYRILLDATSDMVFLKDDRLRYIFVNPRLLMFYGMSEEQVLGKTDGELQLRFATDTGLLVPWEASVLQSGQMKSFKREIEGRTYEFRLFPVHLDEGRSGIGGYIRDCTSERIMQKELSLNISYPQFTPMPIIEMDPLGHTVYQNPTAARLFSSYKKEGFKEKYIQGAVETGKRLKLKNRASEEREIDIADRRFKQYILYIKETGNIRIYGEDVTKRKKAEKALEESESRFRKYIEHSSDLVMVILRDETIYYASPSVERLLGYKQDEVIGTEGTRILKPDENEFIQKMIDNAFENPGVPNQVFEISLLNKNGTWRVFESTGTAFSDNSGEVYLVSNNRDITDRKEMEEALRKSEERYRLLAENSTDFIWTIDPKTSRYTYVSPSVMDVLGYSPEEAKDLSPDVILTAKGREDARIHVQALIGRVRKGPVAQNMKVTTAGVEHIRKDGSVVALESTISAVFDDSGKTVAIQGSSRDITERMKMEEALRKSEERYRLLAENSTDFIWTIDPKTSRYTYVSPSVMDVLGYSPEEATGMEPDVILTARGRESARKHIRTVIHAIREGNILLAKERIEVEHVRKDGSLVWLDSSISIVFDKSGKVVAIQGSSRDITERMKMEEELRKSEERYRLFAENSTDLIWAVDPTTIKFSYVSPSVERVLGYTMEEAVAVEQDRLMTPESLILVDNHIREINESLQRGENPPSAKLEIENIRKDGSGIWVELIATPVVDNSGRVTTIQGISRDITERKKMEDALRKSEERYRFLVDNVQDMIWTIDPKTGRYSYVSRSMERLLGYTQEELLSMYVRDIVAPGSTEKTQMMIDPVKEKGAAGKAIDAPPIEVELIRKDGSTVWTENMASLIFDEEGNFILAQGITRDISERKQIEDALRKSEERYRLLAENSSDVIWVIDPRTGRHVYASPSAERTIGYTPEELLALDPNQLITPETLPLIKNYEKDIIELVSKRERPEPKILEVRATRKDGLIIWLELTVTPVIDDEGELVAIQGMSRDITERKQAEKELAERTVELARSNKELEQFAYIASHDLQEPLRMVASYTGLLAKRYAGRLDSDADEFIGYAIDGANRMKQLINDLLIYSRVGMSSKPFKPINTQMLIKQVSLNLKIAIEDTGATIDCESLPVIMGDGIQIGQLFQNLIGNAIKFRGPDPPHIRISARPQDDNWLFTVEDNGIGIDPQFADRIFIIFQRLHTRREYEGTGIGLAICKKVVERHGGTIWVESVHQKGSKFYFTIPMKGVRVE